MKRHNADNERIKRQYFCFLREAKRNSTQSVDAAAAAIKKFEVHSRCRDFKRFHIEMAIAFKRHIAEEASQATGVTLSKASQRSILISLRKFFLWLADRPGYKKRIRYSDCDYFNLSEHDMRIAQATRIKPFPSLLQLHAAIAAMSNSTVVEKRDRAVIALTMLTGCRDGALSSLMLKHVDLGTGQLFLDAREVDTKFRKSFTTTFYPIGGQAREHLSEWINLLQTELLWSPTDPLFPKTRMEATNGAGFKVSGLERQRWRTASPIRRIFRNAFNSAGLPSYNPHSIRDTLTQLGQQVCRTPEEFKAWSQNMGHDDVMTTFKSYGNVSPARQAQIIQTLSKRQNGDHEELQRLLLRAAESLGVTNDKSEFD